MINLEIITGFILVFKIYTSCVLRRICNLSFYREILFQGEHNHIKKDDSEACYEVKSSTQVILIYIYARLV